METGSDHVLSHLSFLFCVQTTKQRSTSYLNNREQMTPDGQVLIGWKFFIQEPSVFRHFAACGNKTFVSIWFI